MALQLLNLVGRNWIDDGIEVEGWDLWVILFNIHTGGIVVGHEGYLPRPVIVQMREGNFVLCSDRLPNDNLSDIVEFVPILILFVNIPVERFELRTARNSYVKSFGSEERFQVKQVVVVTVYYVRQ